MRILKVQAFWLLFSMFQATALQSQPPLLPMPRSVSWSGSYLDVSTLKSIVYDDTLLRPEAFHLQYLLSEIGVPVTVIKGSKPRSGVFFLKLLPPVAGQEEAYELQVSKHAVRIQATTRKGVFYALQTLKQLFTYDSKMPTGTIVDAPAFGWRGYMVDVGRNYMSMELLKKQIDIMAAFKLNVFHFHPTEDIAWRIEVPGFPQLTDPETMIRNKGSFYSVAEVKELIAYCKERHILFLPEIDMPGHSAAFRRAMKCDMQSDSGLNIIKDILSSLCKTYDFPFIHIGADEVKIKNDRFIPEVSELLRSLGKEIIGWQPGGNFTDQTIRQLWMEDMKAVSGTKALRYIDSRHLYLNHMDPMEAVTTIYHRQISNKEQGDSLALGATLCLWHDRNVNKEEDLMHMNPVLSGMLTFAERVWKGGGKKGWVATLGRPDTEEVRDFRRFEDRLLKQGIEYEYLLPFHYIRQSYLNWYLMGPYKNDGELNRSFEPEQSDPWKIPAADSVVGTTVILRHWWTPVVKGVLDNPTENTTWYARARIWSDTDTIRPCWIGFNNFSRSYTTDSPPAGAWDLRKSQIWVNNQLIPSPQWRRPGAKGALEEPLIDEGYEYRPPQTIFLKKGWNTVLVKCPVGTFSGSGFGNPVKWMFSFSPL